MGIPASGKSIDYGWIGIFRLVDIKIDEAWIQENNLWMMQQSGMELTLVEGVD